MLDVALDAALRLVFDEDAAGAQHVGVQLGLAGAVATHAVDVHAGLQHVGGDDGGVGLVGGDGGDDVGALDGFGGRAGADDLEAAVLGEVPDQLLGGVRIHVIDGNLLDAQLRVEGQRLELALGAVADQRHALGVRAGQGAGCHQRGGTGAQCGGDGQLRQQHRIAGVHVGQHAEGHDGVHAALGVAGVAVDVLEGIALGVGDGHQLDHADVGVVGHARGLVELGPVQEVVADGVGQLADEAGHADVVNQFRHRGYVDEAGHGNFLLGCGRILIGRRAVVERSVMGGAAQGGVRPSGTLGFSEQVLLADPRNAVIVAARAAILKKLICHNRHVSSHFDRYG